MNVDQLIENACALTGLSDFGDPGFRDGLEVLVDGLDNEAQLTEIGQLVAEGAVTGALANRLRVTAWHHDHPDLADQQVTAPLFIVGVSRSGTTALSHLLSRDPANRSLLGWEASEPVPPPQAETYRTDPRFLAAIEAEENNPIHQLNPDFKAMHHDPADMPVECITVMAHDFVSLQYNAMFNLESYADWILERDQVPTYRYHQSVLQLLQSEVPGRWQLKSPHHGLAVEEIAAVYPDARFIWTHRDPATCIASTASITRSLSGTFSDAEWSLFEGRLWSRMLDEMLTRTQRARDRLGDARFVDVSYRELVDDPLGAVRRLYADLGEELSPAADAAMAEHVAVHRQHRFGRHSYEFGEFGLDRGEIDERFAEYRARYGC